MFDKAPELWHLDNLVKYCDTGEQVGLKANGTEYWAPARPEGSHYSFADRLSLAWMVFSGKADAVYWSGGQ